MSRLMKKNGFNTRFLNLSDHVKCQMYSNYHSAIKGIGKNVFDFLGKSTPLLFFLMFIIFFFLFLPFPLLFYCIAVSSAWTLHILTVVILYTLTWMFTFLGMRLNWWYSFFWPVFYLNLLYMGVWSWFRTISGKGFLWKDRKVS
jgi:chlorobactene glucosyltransferase